MTYYYLAADGTTAGPEPLDLLTGLAGSGAISLATLVVPAGGEDWTPLARVLRFFYPDESGATTGPVAFSELHRLNQIAALTAETWVLEEGGSEWKALVDVLAAGGVAAALPAAPVAAPPLPRTATGAYRPQAGGKTQAVHAADPYAPPHSSTGHHRTVIVKRKALGGIERMPFFLIYFLLLILDFALFFIFVFTKFSDQHMLFLEFHAALMQSAALLIGLFAVTSIVTTFLTFVRLKNIGWTTALVLIHLAFVFSVFIPGHYGESDIGSLVKAGLSGAGLLLLALMLVLPPGFARHRRLDTAAWINMILIPLTVAGIIFGLARLVEHSREKARQEALSVEKSLPQP